MAYSRNAYAIERAGGLPVLIPSGVTSETLRQLYERVDGVLMPGGGDVNPALYDRSLHPKTAGIDDLRDSAETQLIRWAADDNRPLLGICRGNQMLNVALGGTLVQDIGSETDTPFKHNYKPPEIPLGFRAHHVTIAPESRLAKIVGTTELEVNSLHHQAVDQPAPGMRISACGPDGIIEGLEMPGKLFALSVQWHPENLTEDPVMLRLFEAFVHACATARA